MNSPYGSEPEDEVSGKLLRLGMVPGGGDKSPGCNNANNQTNVSL